jgi:hypothetical protein
MQVNMITVIRTSEDRYEQQSLFEEVLQRINLEETHG